MATSHVGPRELHLVPPAKIRPIFAKRHAHRDGAECAPVTANRLHGVARPTTEVSDATIAVGHPSLPGLIAEATAIALQNLDVLERHAREVAFEFRSAELASGQRGLRNLVQSTRTLLRLAAMAAHATGTNVRALCRTTRSTADRQTQQALDQLTAVLIAKDWTALANLLDREYTVALGAWRSIFETLGDSSLDPDPNGLAA
jgi:hypothetical protein